MKTVLLENLIHVDAQSDQEAIEIINKIKEQIQDSIKELHCDIKEVHSILGTERTKTDAFMNYMHENKIVNTDNYRLEYIAAARVKIYPKHSQKTITVKSLEEFNEICSKLKEKEYPSIRICSESGEPIQKGYIKQSGWCCSEKYFPQYILSIYGEVPWKVENNIVYVFLNNTYIDTEIIYHDWTQNETLVIASQKYEKMTGIKAMSKKNNDMNITKDTTKPIVKS